MKRKIILFCIFTSFILLAACGNLSSINYICYTCDTCTNKVVWTDYDESICYNCAIDDDYSKCRECGSYYIVDYLFSSDKYCCKCFELHLHTCFLCWASCYEPTIITVNSEDYYICPNCTTQYFANVEPIKPCYFCIECGEVFSGEYFEHSVYCGAKICKDCIYNSGYEQCIVCKKYNTELINQICGLCIETGR